MIRNLFRLIRAILVYRAQARETARLNKAINQLPEEVLAGDSALDLIEAWQQARADLLVASREVTKYARYPITRHDMEGTDDPRDMEGVND